MKLIEIGIITSKNKCEIQVIISMIMPTRSSERSYNPMRYTSNDMINDVLLCSFELIKIYVSVIIICIILFI